MSDDANGSLHDLLRTFERMKQAGDDAMRAPPEMMGGLGEAGRAYTQGGRQQGKTHRVNEQVFIGMDAANRRGDRAACAFRGPNGQLFHITFEPSERVTPDSIKTKVREALRASVLDKLQREQQRERDQIEHDAEKAGHRIVEGTVVGRSTERTEA